MMITQHKYPSLLWLSATLSVVSMSMWDTILVFIQLLMFAAFGMRLALQMGWQTHLPRIRTLNLLAILCALILAYFSLSLGMLVAMANLLTLACALKLMVVRQPRDYFQLISACFFLIGVGFIFNQSLVYTFIYLSACGGLLVSTVLYQAPSIKLPVHIRNIGIMSAQSLPIAILVFVLFPKLPPLWQMPTSKPSSSGISEVVAPGDIAELSQSGELAFRVQFDGEIPTAPQRYWRALALEAFDGKRWFIAEQRRVASRQYRQYNQEFAPEVSGPAFSYDVFAEPTQQRWLYALDVAKLDNASQRSVWQSYSYQLIAEQALVSKFTYSVDSYPQTPLNQTIENLDKRLNLQVPSSGNERTRQWVAELRKQYPRDETFIQALLGYFIQQEFRYTLRPDAMETDPIDTFLFDRQAGFCAHFASAMAYSLRLAGIPARMVTGYQGGEMRENNYMSIYQYDAHAWVEAWIDDRGWIRFDPTGTVSPDRISYGLERALAEEGSFLEDAPFSLAKLSNIAWINQIRLWVSDVDFQWSRWVLGFNRSAQESLLESIVGQLNTRNLMILSFSALAIVITLLGLYFLPNWTRDSRTPTEKNYHRALLLLKSKGLARPVDMPARAFSDYIRQQAADDVADLVEKITCIYEQQQYRPHQKEDPPKEIHALIKELKDALKENKTP